MTPEQKIALESLVGRELSEQEITDIDPLLRDRQDIQIAEILSVGRVRLVETYVDEGKILSTIGLVAGNALLDAIDADPLFKHAKKQLTNRGLDVSQALVRQSLDAMAASEFVSGFEKPHADAIKNLARQPDPVHFNAVSDALNVAEGRLTLENF